MSAASAHALDESFKPLERAIIWAQKDVVTNILKQSGSLNAQDKKQLTELAQKWAKYRKTTVTPGDRRFMQSGAFFMGVAVAPWAAYASSNLVRFWVKGLFGPGGNLFVAAPIATFFTLYFLIVGIPLFQMGWSCGGSYHIEQSAHAILKLIKNAPVTKAGEKSENKNNEQANGIGNGTVPTMLKK